MLVPVEVLCLGCFRYFWTLLWVFRFYTPLELMLGYVGGLFFRLCWLGNVGCFVVWFVIACGFCLYCLLIGLLCLRDFFGYLLVALV